MTFVIQPSFHYSKFNISTFKQSNTLLSRNRLQLRSHLFRAVITCQQKPSIPVSRREICKIMLLSTSLVFSLPLGKVFAKEKVSVEKPEQLKKQVESLKYDEELILNPDPAEKDPLRYKPPPKEPEYRKEEQKLLQTEEEKYQNMVKEELKEESELRAKFGKNKK
eukprot:jgi/Galph1/491/GphlegSOOS_G5240.1